MTGLTWPYEAVADAAFAGLSREADRLDLEQAPHGLDARIEVELHPLLAEALQGAGFGVAREIRYPSDADKKKRSEGQRCDLVVTPDAQPLLVPGGQGGLFEGPVGCPLHDALWIEVKVAARFKEGGKGGGSARLAWRDVERLAREPGIVRRAVLLVLFTEDEAVAERDLAAWAALGKAQGLLFERPVVRRRRLVDRYGNGALACALFPVVGLARPSVG